jgi:hypothetical protein
MKPIDIVSALSDGRSGRTDVIERLLDEGLDPDTTVDDIPILYRASFHNLENIVRLLLERGANPNIEYPFNNNQTPIFATTNPNIIDILIRYGADVDHKNINGYTALTKTVDIDISRNTIPLIKKLVARGADVNTTDNYGQTPLMKAANKDIRVIKLLLRLGADPDITDNHGKKASDYASSRDKKITLQMAAKRFSKKIFPSEHGRITSEWMEICNTFGYSGLYELRKLIMDNVDNKSFGTLAQFYRSAPTNDYYEFLDFIQTLSKRELCAGLAKYYTATKPEFLSVEYVRGSVRPISEMARKSIQSKRRKSSLYSLAYRKARQSDPEKFREYVSRFDLPNP